MCMKEHHGILYGGVINVNTDHKNLTFHKLSALRVIHWKLFLKQYNVKFNYVPIKINVLPDFFLVTPLNGWTLVRVE